MTRIAHPPLWRTERDGALIHILAARPPLPFEWSAPEAEAVLAEAKEFWHEAPEVTPESQGLALQHGIDPAKPLDSWLPSELRARLSKETQIPTRSEFPTAADVMQFFAGLPAQAEVELLALELDGIEARAADELQRALAWLEGDLTVEERHAATIERSYPAFYQHLAVARNAAWIPRIEEILRTRVRAFVVVGVGHMVGAGSLVDQARKAGIRLERC